MHERAESEEVEEDDEKDESGFPSLPHGENDGTRQSQQHEDAAVMTHILPPVPRRRDREPENIVDLDGVIPQEVEGIVEDYTEYPEGPLGEYTGYIGPQIPNPQFKVTAITHRKDAYWHDILVGRVDNFVMGGFALEGGVYEAVRQRVPSCVAAYLPVSGICRMHVYLQLEKPRRGDAKEAIMAAIPVDFRLKHVFVFDTDIDIFDDKEAMFALASRPQWDKDVMIFEGTRIAECDPTAPDEGVMTKGGIDCTKPAEENFSELNKTDDEVFSKIQLEDFISKKDLESMKTEIM